MNELVEGVKAKGDAMLASAASPKNRLLFIDSCLKPHVAHSYVIDREITLTSV